MHAPPIAKQANTKASSNDKSVPKRATHFERRHDIGGGRHLLMLQRIIGNQAVLQLLRQQDLIKDGHDSPTQDAGQENMSVREGPPRSAWDFSIIPLFPPERVGRCQPPSLLTVPRLLGPVQAKLEVGAVDDPLEREADRVAEQVMRMPAPERSVTTAPPQTSRKCAEWESEEKKLPQNGMLLPADLRSYFEPRFGADFSKVRVHDNAAAGAVARTINARAFTLGRNIAFAPGAYVPGTTQGRWLLAHELAHVVQQTTGRSSSSSLQKAPDQKKAPQQKPRRNVVLLAEGWLGGKELSGVLAHGGVIIPVTSVAEAAKALAKVDGPINTLYFVTHSTADGALKFGKDEGFVKAADIAGKLKGSVLADNAPLTVDFRGCSVGNDPKAMEDIRLALGAQSVIAGNCYAIIQLKDPIALGLKGKENPIIDPIQLSPKNEEQRKKRKAKFKEFFRLSIDHFAADAFGNKKECILTKTEEDYFVAGGHFVGLFFNKHYDPKWIDGESVCYNEALHQRVDPKSVDPNKLSPANIGCKLIVVDVKP